MTRFLAFLRLSSILLQRRQWHPTPVLSPSKIPWMEEPGRLRSTGSLRVRHNWVTSLSLSLSCIREGNGNPLQRSCLENPRDGGAWWAAVYGVAQSRTRLKQLSSSSSSSSILLCGLGHSRHTHCVWLSITLWILPTRLLCPWDSPDKNNGVGCHAFLQDIHTHTHTRTYIYVYVYTYMYYIYT